MNTSPGVASANRYTACLLGGAIGDALGAPVEFDKRRTILQRFGPGGIRDYAPAYGGLGRITDDTQMTLFTAEGLIRSWTRSVEKGISTVPGVVAHAYLRWLRTQGQWPKRELEFGTDRPGWLIGHRSLHSQRAPGTTCLQALVEMPALGEFAKNDRKGCGGVMRVAPVGLFALSLGDTPENAFTMAADVAHLTHGHPSGYLPAGVLAVLVMALVEGKSLPEAVRLGSALLKHHDRHEETLRAIQEAVTLAERGVGPEAAIRRLGEGWVAEEALAIALYCALVAPTFEEAIVLAVNHDGDSDSTGAIVGNLLGAALGTAVIPERWLAPLELRDVVEEIARDLATFPTWVHPAHGHVPQAMFEKYPGW